MHLLRQMLGQNCKVSEENPMTFKPLFSNPFPKVVPCFPSFSIHVPRVPLSLIWSQDKVQSLVLKLVFEQWTEL